MKTTFDTTILLIFILAGVLQPGTAYGQDHSDPLIRYAGGYAVLTVAAVTDRTIEITMAPLPSVTSNTPVPVPDSRILVDYPRDVLFESRSVMDPVHRRVGKTIVDVLRSPLRIYFRDSEGEMIQQIRWPEEEDGRFVFHTASTTFERWNYGSGESENGEDPETDQKIVMGTTGWALFVEQPEGENHTYVFTETVGAFIPDPDRETGPVRLFVILWDEPEQIISEFRVLAGEAPLPPVLREMK